MCAPAPTHFCKVANLLTGHAHLVEGKALLVSTFVHGRSTSCAHFTGTWLCWCKAAILPGFSVCMSDLCFLAASRLRHTLGKVRLFSCNKSSVVSPLLAPSIIWSQMLFSVQASEQNLHVFASSCNAIRGHQMFCQIVAPCGGSCGA